MPPQLTDCGLLICDRPIDRGTAHAQHYTFCTGSLERNAPHGKSNRRNRLEWGYAFDQGIRARFLGVPPTGKTIAVQAMNIYRLSDVQFVQEHGQPDMLGLLPQIGAVPAA
jgi:SnoaL-like polyketide cyclase